MARSKPFWWTILVLNAISVWINGFHVMHGDVEVPALGFMLLSAAMIPVSGFILRLLHVLSTNENTNTQTRTYTQETCNVIALRPYAENRRLQRY